MKKRRIAPENFQPNKGSELLKIEVLQESPYSWSNSSCDLREFPIIEFEVFSDEELKAMALTVEDLKAMSWDLDPPLGQS